MDNICVRVDGLGKRYRIGTADRYGRRLTESLWEALKSPVKKLKASAQADTFFWALKDINLEIAAGQAVGIIGRNGAGKTTLLKILSRITEPTEGIAEISGRVGSLLEVGTGFHPDLTGRENVFLNGAILGMRKAETLKKFDEIVAFAEVEKFLDTPVKRYSTGMHVRLAFAVAAHLEPDVLIVDEVLSVGDAAFQKKCIGKLGDVAGAGRTVFFVSHNLGALRQVATRGIWLDRGRVLYDGDISDASSRYLASGRSVESEGVDLRHHPSRPQGMKAVLTKAKAKTTDGRVSGDFFQSDQGCLEFSFEAPAGVSIFFAAFNLNTSDGIKVGSFGTHMQKDGHLKLPQSGKIVFTVPMRQFTPGTYFVTPLVGSRSMVVEDQVDSPLAFTVHASEIFSTGYLASPADGVMTLSAEATVESDIVASNDPVFHPRD